MKRAIIVLLKAVTLIIDMAAILSITLVIGIADFEMSALPMIIAMMVFPFLWALFREFMGNHGWTIGLPSMEEYYEAYDLDDEDEEYEDDPILAGGFRRVG